MPSIIVSSPIPHFHVEKSVFLVADVIDVIRNALNHC